MRDYIRREARAAVDPIILKLRRELFGSGYFGRVQPSALPPTVVYVPQIPTEVSNAGFIRGVTTQQNAITVGVDQKTLNFSGFVVTSVGSVSTIQVPSLFQGITTQQNGATVGTSQTTLNFSGFTVTSSGSTSTVQANPTGVTTQQEENTVGTSQTTLNFSGLIVTSNGSTSTIRVPPVYSGVETRQNNTVVGAGQTILNFSGLSVTSSGSMSTITVPTVYSGVETRQNNTTVGTGQTVLNFSGLSVTSNDNISTVSVPSVYSGIETRENNVVIGAGQTALNFNGLTVVSNGAVSTVSVPSVYSGIRTENVATLLGNNQTTLSVSGFAASSVGNRTAIESAFSDAQIIQGAQPANPASGRVRIWATDTANREMLYARFSSGAQRRLAQYAVRLRNTVSFYVANTNAYVQVSLPSVAASSHPNLSMSDGIGFVAPETGIYYASAIAYVPDQTYGFVVSIFHNDTPAAEQGIVLTSSNMIASRFQTSAIVSMNANDTLRMYVITLVATTVAATTFAPSMSVFSL